MDSIDKIQEEGIPPREVSWIDEDSEDERDHDTLSDEGEEDSEDALDAMWIGKEEL